MNSKRAFCFGFVVRLLCFVLSFDWAAACGMISVPWAGIKLRLLAVNVLSPNHWTARAILSPKRFFFLHTCLSHLQIFLPFQSTYLLYNFLSNCTSKVFQCSVEKDTTVCFSTQQLMGTSAVSRFCCCEQSALLRTHGSCRDTRSPFLRAGALLGRTGVWWCETCQAALQAGLLMSSVLVALHFWVSSDSLCYLTKNLRPFRPWN